MDENLTEAVIMVFSVLVFIIALTLTMYMFSKVTYTSEVLIKNADTTRFYENVELGNISVEGTLSDDAINGRIRIVDSNTVIPTLYRYYKENFCVKIYDASYDIAGQSELTHGTEIAPRLVQIFDVSLEGQVNKAISDSNATETLIDDTSVEESVRAERRRNYALKEFYNKGPLSYSSNGWTNSYDVTDRVYMFGAPWIGSTDNAKRRLDYFIAGTDGFINNVYVNYIGNSFYKSINERDAQGNPKYAYVEQVVSYSYTGDTVETDEGEVLVTGAAAKDKIVIIYSIINNNDMLKVSRN